MLCLRMVTAKRRWVWWALVAVAALAGTPLGLIAIAHVHVLEPGNPSDSSRTEYTRFHTWLIWTGMRKCTVDAILGRPAWGIGLDILWCGYTDGVSTIVVNYEWDISPQTCEDEHYKVAGVKFYSKVLARP